MQKSSKLLQKIMQSKRKMTNKQIYRILTKLLRKEMRKK